MFLPADVQKKTLHDVHWRAWEKGVKSLYYCRSKSVARAESHASESVTGAIANTDTVRANGNTEPLPLAASGENENDYEECLSASKEVARKNVLSHDGGGARSEIRPCRYW